MELMCGPIGHEKLTFRFPGHGNKIGESLADRHLGRDAMGFQVDQRNGAAALVGDQEERSLIYQSHGDGISESRDRLGLARPGLWDSAAVSSGVSTRDPSATSKSGRTGRNGRSAWPSFSLIGRPVRGVPDPYEFRNRHFDRDRVRQFGLGNRRLLGRIAV